MAKGRTQRYYDANPAANRRRLKQQSKYQKTAKGRRLKINANKANRKLGLWPKSMFTNRFNTSYTDNCWFYFQ